MLLKWKPVKVLGCFIDYHKATCRRLPAKLCHPKTVTVFNGTMILNEEASGLGVWLQL